MAVGVRGAMGWFTVHPHGGKARCSAHTISPPNAYDCLPPLSMPVWFNLKSGSMLNVYDFLSFSKLRAYRAVVQCVNYDC